MKPCMHNPFPLLSGNLGKKVHRPRSQGYPIHCIGRLTARPIHHCRKLPAHHSRPHIGNNTRLIRHRPARNHRFSYRTTLFQGTQGIASLMLSGYPCNHHLSTSITCSPSVPGALNPDPGILTTNHIITSLHHHRMYRRHNPHIRRQCAFSHNQASPNPQQGNQHKSSSRHSDI